VLLCERRACTMYRRCGTDRHNGRFDKAILRQVDTYEKKHRPPRNASRYVSSPPPCSLRVPLCYRATAAATAALLLSRPIRACAAARPISRNYRGIPRACTQMRRQRPRNNPAASSLPHICLARLARARLDCQFLACVRRSRRKIDIHRHPRSRR